MIRDFRRGDTDQVMRMVEELKAESPSHRDLPFDRAYVARLMNSFTVRGWVAQAAGEDTLRGYCFATIVPSMLGPGRICTDLSVFVRKAFRNGLIAVRFLEAMEQYGRDQGCIMHQHVVSTGNPGLDRIYERFGYTRTGGAFVRVTAA
jgi:GNAT superfamily N-acetyltransferase